MSRRAFEVFEAGRYRLDRAAAAASFAGVEVVDGVARRVATAMVPAAAELLAFRDSGLLAGRDYAKSYSAALRECRERLDLLASAGVAP